MRNLRITEEESICKKSKHLGLTGTCFPSSHPNQLIRSCLNVNPDKKKHNWKHKKGSTHTHRDTEITITTGLVTTEIYAAFSVIWPHPTHSPFYCFIQENQGQTVWIEKYISFSFLENKVLSSQADQPSNLQPWLIAPFYPCRSSMPVDELRALGSSLLSSRKIRLEMCGANISQIQENIKETIMLMLDSNLELFCGIWSPS